MMNVKTAKNQEVKRVTKRQLWETAEPTMQSFIKAMSKKGITFEQIMLNGLRWIRNETS